MSVRTTLLALLLLILTVCTIGYFSSACDSNEGELDEYAEFMQQPLLEPNLSDVQIEVPENFPDGFTLHLGDEWVNVENQLILHSGSLLLFKPATCKVITGSMSVPIARLENGQRLFEHWGAPAGNDDELACPAGTLFIAK